MFTVEIIHLAIQAKWQLKCSNVDPCDEYVCPDPGVPGSDVGMSVGHPINP